MEILNKMVPRIYPWVLSLELMQNGSDNEEESGKKKEKKDAEKTKENQIEVWNYFLVNIGGSSELINFN